MIDAIILVALVTLITWLVRRIRSLGALGLLAWVPAVPMAAAAPPAQEPTAATAQLAHEPTAATAQPSQEPTAHERWVESLPTGISWKRAAVAVFGLTGAVLLVIALPQVWITAGNVDRGPTDDRAANAPSTKRSLVEPGDLLQPTGGAVGRDGTIYVADQGKNAVVAISLNGGLTRVLGEGRFKEPSDVAILPNGDLLVLDAGNNSLTRMSTDGEQIQRLTPDPGLFGPRGLDTAADGRILIADTGNNRLFLLTPGLGGRAIDGLREPTDAAFLSDGTILVAEVGSRQLTIVRADGSRPKSWPMPAAYTGIGPHIATLPGGGWVATAPEAGATIWMAPTDLQPRNWLRDPTWKKPVGIAAGASGVVIIDAEASTATLVPLP